jgi:anthranilate/para-aminobenzoate synthase component II
MKPFDGFRLNEISEKSDATILGLSIQTTFLMHSKLRLQMLTVEIMALRHKIFDVKAFNPESVPTPNGKKRVLKNCQRINDHNFPTLKFHL